MGSGAVHVCPQAIVLVDGSESRKKCDELIYFIVCVIGRFLFYSIDL